MTKLLEQAFAAVSRLPEAEQNTVAARLLEHVEAESKWDEIFQASSDALLKQASQALAEFRLTDDDHDIAHD